MMKRSNQPLMQNKPETRKRDSRKKKVNKQDWTTTKEELT